MSERAGRAVTLGDIPESEFREWVDAGFTHVWLMGVWSTGPRAMECARTDRALLEAGQSLLLDFTPADLVGSPYAISSYNVPADLGGSHGLKVFREKLNAWGLRLLVDFVPNHVGLDHPWLRLHPEYLVPAHTAEAGFTFSLASSSTSQKADSSRSSASDHSFCCHGRDPYFPAWTDTAQVDYRSQSARSAMLDQLRKVSDLCDGVRCDMAMLILEEVFNRTWKNHPAIDPAAASGEFWATAISLIKTVQPGFLFLAEAYWGLEQRLLDLGFDYVYDKTWYDQLVSRDFSAVRRHLETSSPPLLARGTRFLENHDEPGIAALLPPDEHLCAAAHLLALPGICLLHERQLAGARSKVPVQLARRPAGDLNREVQDMYGRLLHVYRACGIRRGQFRLLSHAAQHGADAPAEAVFVFLWEAAKSQGAQTSVISQQCSGAGDQHSPANRYAVVAINHGLDDTSVLLDGLPAEAIRGRWTEVLRNDSSTLQRPPGEVPPFRLRLPAKSVRIFRVD